MSGPKRVVVVDDDAGIRMLLERALRQPEFVCHAFGDARDALQRLHDLHPDLIICDVMMPEMDGYTFYQVVKRSRELRSVPFIFLSAVRVSEEILAILDKGADDFLNKPFPLPQLVAKVRALLRLVDRVDGREHTLSGSVTRAGLMPLLKFCEDSRLTGRLLLESRDSEWWADFLGGELVEVSGEKHQTTGGGGSRAQALEDLLSLDGAVYRIQQKPLDPEALRARARSVETETAQSPRPMTVPMPEGRYSVVPVRDRQFQVYTEAANRPNFTITTVISERGKAYRKIETCWPHPLQRAEDRDSARRHIDRQHERAVTPLHEVTMDDRPPREVWGAGRRSVEASLLAWALSFVAERARSHVGNVIALAMLRRSHQRLVPAHRSLESFKVLDDGRVSPQLCGRSRLPEEAVTAVAEWTVAFLDEAAAVAPGAVGLSVRQVTRMLSQELERAGFYAACDRAARRASQVRMRPTERSSRSAVSIGEA